MTQTDRTVPPEVPRAVQIKSAAALEADYLTCRMMRHNWERVDPETNPLWTAWGTPIAWECDRCGMVRTDVIDALGEVSWRNYKRPDGYGIEAARRPKTNILRLEYLKRLKAGKL